MRRHLWSALVVVNIFLLGIFLAGYCAKWIDPRVFWWPQLFAIAFPLTTLLVAVIAGIYVLLRKWPVAGFHLVCLILAGPRFLSLGAHSDTSSLDDSVLRIASYNLGQLETHTQEDLTKTLRDVVRLMNPDVFCMQEFLIRYRGNPLRFRNLPVVASMFDSLGYQVVASHNHSVANSFKPVLTHRGKVNMVSKESISLAEEGIPEMSVIRAVIEWQGREAAVYNVHLHTFGERKPWTEKILNPINPAFWSFFVEQYRDAFLYRAWQADQVHELVSHEQLPVIVIGDFNSTPNNWVFNRIATGLRDVYKEAGVKSKASYHSRMPVVRIDHVLVSEEWEVVGADILPYPHSDHRPLLVLLGWKE